MWNAIHAKDFYPDWICRFYHDDTVPIDILDSIKFTGAEMVLCERSIKSFGLFWRFQPFIDDCKIERFIVRDADSRINQREVEMVEEWIKLDKMYHIIRDHKQHDVPMVGGAWGAKAGALIDFTQRFKRFLDFFMKKEMDTYFGTDQLFMQKLIWPVAISNHVAHILAGEKKLKFTRKEIEVPPPIDGHFVCKPYAV